MSLHGVAGGTQYATQLQARCHGVSAEEPELPAPGKFSTHYIFRPGVIASQLCAALPNLALGKSEMLNCAEVAVDVLAWSCRGYSTRNTASGEVS